jgi:predicted TIM-barrel fold metal-dependent hydrolase
LERITMNAIPNMPNLPSELQHLAGQIMDSDTHEAMPAQVWTREIGPVMKDLAQHWLTSEINSNVEKNHPNVPGYTADDSPVDRDKVWSQKGCASPGAVQIRRRLEVMDVMGVRRQLMYPGAGLYAHYLLYLDNDYGFASSIKRPNIKEYGAEAVAAYNDWGVRVAQYSDRVRPVLPVFAETMNDLMDKTTNLVNNGIRAIWMFAVLPGGKSPAHPDLDPFWDLLERNNVTLCIHGGLESKIFGTDAWWEVPAFQGYRVFGEFRLDPWSMAHTHTRPRNFLLTVVLGGVFDRHPMLRFAITEAGADWIGHLCDHLDLWHAQDLGGVVVKGQARTTYRLPRLPSDYIKRNVRVTPFNFEPVDKYIRQYDLSNVLCFSSDYPHVEGGFNPAHRNYELLQPLGEEVVEKFFVKNAQWILPD